MELVLSVSALALILYTLFSFGRRIQTARLRGRMETRAGTAMKSMGRASDMPSGATKKFCLVCGRVRIDGLLVAVNGDFHAYVNVCRHMETPLDWVQERFLSADGRYLSCGTHGALYEPRTGKCVEGPCKGLSLFSLPVEVIDGDVMVKCPEGDLAHLGN